jgi:hypothetical protein
MQMIPLTETVATEAMAAQAMVKAAMAGTAGMAVETPGVRP